MADSVVIENIINLQQLIEQKYAEVTMETTNTTTITTLESTTVEGVTEENTTVDSTTVVEKKKKKSSKKSKKSKQDSTAKQVRYTYQYNDGYPPRLWRSHYQHHCNSVNHQQFLACFWRSCSMYRHVYTHYFEIRLDWMFLIFSEYHLQFFGNCF